MAAWYDCLLLKNRSLTDHEKEKLDRVNVRSVSANGVDVMIGPKESLFTRPMYVQLTHYHHLDALLAIMACYFYPGVESSYNYPVRQVHRGEGQPPDHASQSPVKSDGRGEE